MNTPISKKWILTLLALILVLGGSIFFWDRYGRESKTLRTNPILKKDYELLKHENGSTSLDGIGIALHRLNSYRLPEGKREAMKRLSDPRAQVRASVAESLGMHPLVGEIVDAEVKLLKDSDESVRIAAVDALSRSGDKRRSELLGEALSHPSLSARELMAIHGGLALATQGPEREGHIKVVRDSISKNQNELGMVLQGLKVLVRISPNDQESISLIQGAYQNSATPKEVLPSLYRYLVRNRPEYLRKRFLQDVRSGTLPVRVTALNSMMELCPPERWSAIQSILMDSKTEVQVKSLASRVAGFLGGKVGQKGELEKPGPGADRCEQRVKNAPLQSPHKSK